MPTQTSVIPGKNRPGSGSPIQREEQAPPHPGKIETKAKPVVYDGNGVAKHLGAQIARGGEGLVSEVQGQPNLLVKVYKSATYAQQAQNKLEYMIRQQAMKDTPFLAWPRILVYNKQAEVIGYAMRRQQGISMHTFGNPILVRERLPGWNRQDTIRCAISFLRRLDSLHQKGVLIGDINPGNFLIDPNTYEVSFIDCDSYQVQDRSPDYFCKVGIHQFMAPEAIRKNLKQQPRTVEEECFASFILVYRMLMLGGHPFAHRHGEDPAANIRKGTCPLGLKSGAVMPKGPWYNIWSHMPYRTKDLFIRMFRDGHGDPAARPTLREAIDVLKIYEGSLQAGHVSNDLQPREPKVAAKGSH